MSGKVVDTAGKEIDASVKPDGALLDLARTFLAEVIAGRITDAVVVGAGPDKTFLNWTGEPITVLGLLAYAGHQVNKELDDEEPTPDSVA